MHNLAPDPRMGHVNENTPDGDVAGRAMAAESLLPAQQLPAGNRRGTPSGSGPLPSSPRSGFPGWLFAQAFSARRVGRKGEETDMPRFAAPRAETSRGVAERFLAFSFTGLNTL